MTAQLKPRLQELSHLTTGLQRDIEGKSYLFQSVHQSWSHYYAVWDLVAIPRYDVSFYIVKSLLYNLIQTAVFDKCNIQFLPCTVYFPK